MYEELFNQLERLKQKDIDTRNKLAREARLYGLYAEEMQKIHIANARALDEIIQQHGWPGVSKVGLDGSRAAWMIAQHSICTPDLQRKFLHYITKAEKQGDVPAKQVALLSDRIRFNEGKPQVYGTVYDWNEDGELFCEVEDPDKVDELRASIGLPPFRESLQKELEAIKSEGGGPPQDYQAYKQAANEWSKSVGWQ